MREVWEKIKFILICYGAIAVILLVCAYGFSWILRLFSSGVDRGLALVAGTILAVGSINLLIRLLQFSTEYLDGDMNGDDEGRPDEERPVIVVPPDFPYKFRQTKRRHAKRPKG